MANKNVDIIATRQFAEIFEEHSNPANQEKKKMLKKREQIKEQKRKDYGV